MHKDLKARYKEDQRTLSDLIDKGRTLPSSYRTGTKKWLWLLYTKLDKLRPGWRIRAALVAAHYHFYAPRNRK